jgi:hypothetical protein
MMRPGMVAGLAVAVTAALLGSAGAQALRVGQPAPALAGERWINGGPHTLETLRGRVVLVEFWTYG